VEYVAIVDKVVVLLLHQRLLLLSSADRLMLLPQVIALCHLVPIAQRHASLGLDISDNREEGKYTAHTKIQWQPFHIDVYLELVTEDNATIVQGLFARLSAAARGTFRDLAKSPANTCSRH
jgi:hypothetical protein